VEVEGKPAWLLARDEKTLESPPQPTGTRLLPDRDPFLQQRDRTILLADQAARKRLWRPVGGPGAVLVRGEVVGTWRARVARSRLVLSVEPFGRFARRISQQIEEEAARLAPFRGCDTADVEIAEGI